MIIILRKMSGALLFAGASLALASCAGNLALPGTVSYEQPVYRLASGDRLNITVFGEESLSREYVVSPQGDLSFPLLGDVPIAGKTVAELQTVLAQGLSNGYLNDPRVTAEVLNLRPFYILGEVNKAGEFPYSDNLTVQQAVALAGGFTYRADQRKVYIRRSGQAQEESYDLRAEKPVFVRPGDTLRIGERYF